MKRYIDARLLLFVALAIGASILSAHGAWLFFGYIVEPWLAWVFTLVVALGIIGLDAAATAETGRMRYVYMIGAGFFLVLETLANYFAGQADFARKVEQALAERGSADLLYIVRTYPAGTRALVVLFLSLASISVAYFTYAATRRLQQLHDAGEVPLRELLARIRADFAAAQTELEQVRSAQTETAAERDQARAQLEHVRAEYARHEADAAELLDGSALDLAAARDELSRVRTDADELRTELDQVRAECADLRTTHSALRTQQDSDVAELERLRTDTAELRAERDQVRSEADQFFTESAQLRAEAEQLRTARADAQAAAAREVQLLERERTAKAEAERLRDELAKRSAELREAQSLTTLDVRAIARGLREQNVPLRTIAAALGVSEKTIRNWTTVTEEV